MVRATAKAVFLAALRAGNTRAAAAGVAGVARQTPYKWMEHSLAFGRAVELAEGQAQERLVAVIDRAARQGSWRAALALLSRRWPESWSEQSSLKVELTTDEQAVVNQAMKTLALSMDEKLVELDELRKLTE